jgi:hypothetical protein
MHASLDPKYLPWNDKPCPGRRESDILKGVETELGLRPWWNGLGVIMLVLLGVACFDTTRPVETWHEFGPVQVLEGKGRLWVFLQIQRRFRGHGLLVYRGELAPLYFHKVVEVATRDLRKLADFFSDRGPDLSPEKGKLSLFQGIPQWTAGSRHWSWQNGRWQVGGAEELATQFSGVACLILGKPAPGGTNFLLSGERKLRLIPVPGAETLRLELQLAEEAIAGTLLHRLDTEVTPMALELLREQRRIREN